MFRLKLPGLLLLSLLVIAGCSEPAPSPTPTVPSATGNTPPPRGLDDVKPGMAGVPKDLVR